MSVVAIGGDKPYLYVAQKAGGILVLRETDRRPVQVTTIPRNQLGRLDAMNLHLEGDWLYAAMGDHFAAGGSKAGLAVIDVSQPDRPQVTATWESAAKQTGAGDVLARDGVAYLASMGEGIEIFDVSDPKKILPIARILPEVHYPKPDPNPIAFPHARGLDLAGDRLYVANDAGGLRIIDVSDPSNPHEIGKYVNKAMPNKAQAYNNVAVDGGRAYVATDYCGLEVLDVSDPGDIRQLGWWNPWKCETLGNIWFNSGGHANEVIFDAQAQRVYLSAGDSDLVVLDVSTPAEPKQAALLGAAKDGLGAWGMTVHGGRLYGAYIRTAIPFSGKWSGVKAFNLPKASSVERRSSRRDVQKTGRIRPERGARSPGQAAPR